MKLFDFIFNRHKEEPKLKTVYNCPVHGKQDVTMIVFGSKPLCQKCIADMLDKNILTMEEHYE